MMCKKVVGFRNFIILGFLVTPDQGSKITPPSFCNPRGRESTLNTTEGIWDTGFPLPTDWVWGKSMPANMNRGPLGEAWGPQERRNEQQWQRNRKCHWGRAGARERPSIILSFSSLECGSRLESLDQQMKSQEGLSGFHPDKKLQSPGLPLEMVRSLSLEGWRDWEG